MKKFFVIALILGAFIGNSIYFDERKENKQLTEFINDLESHKLSLTFQIIDQYEQQILDKLDKISSRYDLKKAYYALGYLTFYRSEYNLSNDYFSKALAISSWISTKALDANLSMGMATNYLCLGEDVNSEKFFEKAIQLAVKSKDNQLLAKIYRMRAEGFLTLSNQVDKVGGLLEQALEISGNSSETIECYLLLKDVYLGSLRLEESNKAAVKAFMLAKENGDKDLETKSIIGLIINQFVNKNYGSTPKLVLDA